MLFHLIVVFQSPRHTTWLVRKNTVKLPSINVHIIDRPITPSQITSLITSCITDTHTDMASNSQDEQSTVAEDPLLQNLADASTSTSDSSYLDPEAAWEPYCYPEPGSIKAPCPAGTCGLGSSGGSTVGGKDPTKAPFVCGLCGGRFTRRHTVKTHFPTCATKNGNPGGFAWDSDPSCALAAAPAAQNQNGKWSTGVR